ncbi:MerR family transcriptional regulator [Polaromonas sp. YR568]|uniref:MerR family transcriptional regulator n=1 Tax=Polaromonas sp. YR568 TaxID=1855301 RepID=UPI0031382CBA
MANIPAQPTSEPPTAEGAPQLRIGAVSTLAGVPVSTLRVWEARYSAFSPSKSSGRHRLYSQGDMQKAVLLKQLTDSGVGISTIARLDTPALQSLLIQTRGPALAHTQRKLEARQLTLMVVGVGMASRIASQKFTLKFVDQTIRVCGVFFDLDEACAATLSEKPDLLVVKLHTLQDAERQQMERLMAAHGMRQAIVVYHYGPEAVAETLRLSGIAVRREPVSDYELSDLISSVLLVDAAAAKPANAKDASSPPFQGSAIPARKYSDETLARIAGISTNVLCECPRHVAELIGQLASFEQYSQECLVRHADDAHLHGYLRSVSGAARALFERALELVAEHEGITLDKMGA